MAEEMPEGREPQDELPESDEPEPVGSSDPSQPSARMPNRTLVDQAPLRSGTLPGVDPPGFDPAGEPADDAPEDPAPGDDRDEPSGPESRPRSDGVSKTRLSPSPEELEGAASDDDADQPPEAEDGGDEPARKEPDDEATSATAPFSVQVVEGPDEGVRKRVRGGRMIIGRGGACDFRLSDSSVSRRHVELVSSPSGLVVRDLGSGNGTRVNGEKIDEAALGHDDRIYLGQTVLVVVDEVKRFEEERLKKEAAEKAAQEAEAREKAEREQPKPGPKSAEKAIAAPAPGGTAIVEVAELERKRRAGRSQKQLLLVLGVVTALVVIALFLKLVRPAPPPGTEPTSEPGDEYGLALQAGRKLMAERRWSEALEKLHVARGIRVTTEVTRAIEVADRDAKAQGLLERAKTLAAEGDWDTALGLLKQIDEIADVFDDAKALVAKIEVDRVQAAMREAKRLVEEKKFPEARALLTRLPADLAGPLASEIGAAEEKLQAEEASRRLNDKAYQAELRRRALEEARRRLDEAIAPVVRKIDAGNFEGAVGEIDRLVEAGPLPLVAEKLKKLRRIVPEFGRVYVEGISRYNAGAYEVAQAPLFRALQLYEDMDVAGKLQGPLVEKLSRATLFKAQGCLARQEYAGAAKAFREAQRLTPGSVDAKEGMRQIAVKARDVYLEGYVEMKRSPESARRKFKEVLEMAPERSPVYQDAWRRLEEMDQTLGRE